MKKSTLILAASLLICGAFGLGFKAKAQTKPVTSEKFPAGFLWGSATAAYQVEGGIQNNWSAAGLDAGNEINHWERYEEDFDQAAAMGQKMYRFSIEWARVEPQPGQFDQAAIDHYRQILKALDRRGIQPMVTLYHFTLPQWFVERGGWEKAENIVHFKRFVRRIATELKDDVYYWNTVNEPMVYAFQSYNIGVWPPFKQDINLAMRVVQHLLLAHTEAYHAVHEIDPFAKVGFAKNITVLEPNWPWNPLDQIMTMIQNYLFNEAFWNAIETGQFNLSFPGLVPIKAAFNPRLKNSIDFIGVNYYTRYLVNSSGKTLTRPEVSLTELDWEIYPQGLYRALMLANTHAQKLRVPIIITENGLADAEDRIRAPFLVQHLHQVWQAIQEGVPVQGYLHWSLLDNFEWAEAYEAKFGLMDRDRKWRESARLYQQIIKDNGLSEQMLTEYFKPDVFQLIDKIDKSHKIPSGD